MPVLTPPVSGRTFVGDTWIFISFDIVATRFGRPVNVAATRGLDGRFSGWVGEWTIVGAYAIVVVSNNVWVVPLRRFREHWTLFWRRQIGYEEDELLWLLV